MSVEEDEVKDQKSNLTFENKTGSLKYGDTI
jgi:hypothetical protein